MWVKIDDKLPRHPKVLAAGEIIGVNGAGLALAIYVAADCYCAEHLTDGLIAPAAIRALSVLVRRPHAIAEALVAVNLFERDGKNYRIHDYHDYNPSSDAVKEKRARDRDRKSGRDDSNATPQRIQSDSSCIPERSRAGADARPQDGTGSLTGSGSGISEGEREREQEAPGPVDTKTPRQLHGPTEKPNESARAPVRSSTLVQPPNAYAFWSSVGMHVPWKLHAEIVASLRGENQAQAFYREVDDEWKEGGAKALLVVGDDTFAYWRARKREKFGTTATTAKQAKDDQVARTLRELTGESA